MIQRYVLGDTPTGKRWRLVFGNNALVVDGVHADFVPPWWARKLLPLLLRARWEWVDA